MLMTSLPYHGPLFKARHTPLSRLRLNARLRSLDDQDAQRLADLTSLLELAQHDMPVRDAELIQRAKTLQAAWGDGFLTDLLNFRLELRSLMAALRRKRRGEATPPAEPWGHGRWVRHIERYWQEPGFRLQRVFPWVTEAERLIEAHDSLALERLQLGRVWNHLDRMGAGHEFDFEAVVIYVLRWDLIARWSSYNGAAALRRFDQLAEAGMGRFVNPLELADPKQSNSAATTIESQTV